MKKSQAIFERIFGDAWSSLPPVMHKHYANRPYSNDVVVAEGSMDVELSPVMRLMTPLLRLTGALFPWSARDIPVTVRFCSHPDSDAYSLERSFRAPGRRPYIFYSTMRPQQRDIVIEYMKFGIGWKHRYYYDGGRIILAHRGYVWNIAGLLLPIPLALLLGRGYAEEQAIDASSFRMLMHITHPLLGRIYTYSGTFRIEDEQDSDTRRLR